MAVKPNELAVLEIRGELYQDWETVMVRHSTKESPFYHFRFTCSEGMPLSDNWNALRIKPGDECQVTLAGEPAIWGMVSTRQVFYDAKRHYVEIQGASNVVGLAYTSVVHPTMENKDVTYEQHAKKLLKPFFPKINFVVEGGKLPQITFPRISMPHGMTVIEALELPLRNMGGVKLTSNPKGDLVALAGPSGGEDVVTEGKNILEGREVVFNESMNKETYIPSQGQGSDKASGSKVASIPIVRQAFNAFRGINRYMPGVIPMDLPMINKIQMQARSQMEHNIMNEDRVTVWVAVNGWLRPSGGLWWRNQDVIVNSPMLLMDGQKLTLRTVTFTQDGDRGSRSLLELCNENELNVARPTPGT